MELFAVGSSSSSSSSGKKSQRGVCTPIASDEVDTVIEAPSSSSAKYSFSDLGLCDWLCTSTYKMGFRKPTDIQKACIPAILEGRDVFACAETG